MIKVTTLLYENQLIEQYRKCLENSSEFSLAMALISRTGLNDISAAFRKCMNEGGRGRLLVGIDLPTPPEAIDLLCKWRDEFEGQFELRIFESTGVAIFHPKLSIFKMSKNTLSAIVGSANLTSGGLTENFEASVLIDDQPTAHELLDFFDEMFKGSHSRKVSAKWLERYRTTFELREKALRSLRQSREKVRRLRLTRPDSKPLPKRLHGYTFAFTRGIAKWPREEQLYPLVRSLGGEVAERSSAMRQADCLVHGNVLRGQKSTQKLDAAIKLGIPIITDEEFFRIVKAEKQHSSK